MTVLMPKKPRKSEQPSGPPADDTPEGKSASNGSVRIKPDLAYKLRIICEADMTTAAVFLDPLVRGPIETAFRRVTKHLSSLADREPDQRPQ